MSSVSCDLNTEEEPELRGRVHFRTNSDLNHAQEDIGSGQSSRFFVVEHLNTIAKYLQLAKGAVAHFHHNPFLGCGFAQAHGRAAQVKSKEAAFDFDHQAAKTSFAARMVLVWIVTVSCTLRA